MAEASGTQGMGGPATVTWAVMLPASDWSGGPGAV
jgi:hypothetical protein